MAHAVVGMPTGWAHALHEERAGGAGTVSPPSVSESSVDLILSLAADCVTMPVCLK